MSAVLFDRRPGTVSALRYCKSRRDRQMVVAGCRDLRVKHITLIPGGLPMRLSFAIRVALIALTATIGLATAAYADSGRIRFNVIKAGFVFGGSATDFVGTVSNIRRPSDVNGVYGAAGVGAAVGPGGGVIVLTNQNGATLALSGRQAGLIVAADLNGLVITLR